MPQVAKIPPNVDPIVRFILQRVRGSRAQAELEVAAGLGTDTVRRWHYRKHNLGPRIFVVRRALNAMGYDLAIVPLPDGHGPSESVDPT